MYKKVSSGILVVGFFSLCGVTFGMEREHVLMQLMRKDIIPILLLNDYIINAPTAYQALLREASFGQDIMKPMINSTNEQMRQYYEEKGVVHRVPDAKTCKRVTSYYVQNPCFRKAAILYQNEFGLDAANDSSASLRIRTLNYRISPSNFKSVMHCEYHRILENLGVSIKKDLVFWLSDKWKPVFIELYAPDEPSDWIRIENYYGYINDNCFCF